MSAKPTSIDDYHAAQAPADRAVCDALRPALDAGLPDAESRIWHGHPVWFLGGNPIVGYGKQKAGVRLMFWSGQSFETEGLAPSGSFKAAVVLYTSADDIDNGALAGWLSQSRDIQWDYKNIVKRKGRLDRLS